ncbi:DNA polymerase I [Escherichia phage EP_H11]|nr:DNA polymerase I [Escherichia phage EP_H11]
MNDIPLIPVDCQWLTLRNWFAAGKSQDLGPTVSSTIGSVAKLIKEDGYNSELIMLYDRGKWRYRPKDKNPEYKANREYDESFEALWAAMNILHEQIFPALGIKCIQVSGVEADDLGYYYANSGRPVMLHSRDRDWYLSINENTCVLNPDDGLVDLPWLMKTYDLDDHKDYLIYKAIVGDGSDNIPGVATGLSSVKEAINAYKDGSLSQSVEFRIRSNIELMRLDRILTDTEVHSIIKEQESKVQMQQRILPTLEEFCPGFRFPPYFHGVLGKYNRSVTAKILESA